jgi:hypothetical protein
MSMTLPADSSERKEIPLFSGVLAYGPAALAGMARISKQGNDKHNPGEPLHHARGKSSDHADCIVRHLVDVADIKASIDRREIPFSKACDDAQAERVKALLSEASQLVWRAVLLSQELHEKYGGAPLAPGARLPEPPEQVEKTVDKPKVWIEIGDRVRSADGKTGTIIAINPQGVGSNLMVVDPNQGGWRWEGKTHGWMNGLQVKEGTRCWWVGPKEAVII